jgi:hypothetical protein
MGRLDGHSGNGARPNRAGGALPARPPANLTGSSRQFGGMRVAIAPAHGVPLAPIAFHVALDAANTR